MSLEVKHDFMGQPYVEGDVEGKHIIGEPCRDPITGQPYGKINVNGEEYHIEHAVDYLGRDHYPVTHVPAASASGVGGVFLLLLGIILIPAAIYLPLLVWKFLADENIPELLVISIASVGITSFVILKNSMDFGEALGTAVPSISFLFFLFASILSFVIPTPAMATRFSVGALLGIGLIGFVASLAPSLIIAILSAIKTALRRK